MANQQPNLNSSFYDKINYSYTDALSIELAELQRTVYLPLLPMERLTHSVLRAYEEERIPYWNKDEIYTSVLGNFYVPMLFPMVENPEESIDMLHPAPENSMLLEEGGFEPKEYITRTYIELVIPKYIVMNFEDTIPKGTMFTVGFVGGSNTISNLRVLSVAWLPEETLDENYLGEGPNEPKPNRGDKGEPSGDLIEQDHDLSGQKEFEERENNDVVTIASPTTNTVSNGITGVSSKNSRSGSSGTIVTGSGQVIYGAPKRYKHPSPFSTMVDLSGLNYATVKKKVHEDLELIRKETIRRQKLNARREFING